MPQSFAAEEALEVANETKQLVTKIIFSVGIHKPLDFHYILEHVYQLTALSKYAEQTEDAEALRIKLQKSLANLKHWSAMAIPRAFHYKAKAKRRWHMKWKRPRR